MLCNLIAIAALLALGAEPLVGAVNRWSLLLFIPALGTAMFAPGEADQVTLLLLLVVQYPLVAVLGICRRGPVTCRN